MPTMTSSMGATAGSRFGRSLRLLYDHVSDKYAGYTKFFANGAKSANVVAAVFYV